MSRGVGPRGGRGELAPPPPPPPKFAKCPFSGSKVPFSCVKNVIKIEFFAQRALLKTWIYVIHRKIFFIFGEKYRVSGKLFGTSGKFFSYLGKNVIYPENYSGMSGKFFWDDLSTPPPCRQHFREKIFRCPFFSKSAPQSLAPQLLEASYALVYE
jgi:hypothetical protein